MRDNEPHVRICIRRLRLDYRLLHQREVLTQDRIEEGLVGFSVAFDVQVLEFLGGYCGGAGDSSSVGMSVSMGMVRIGDGDLHVGGNGLVRRGADVTRVVAEVAAEEDEGVRVGRGAREAGDVARGVAGSVEEVEGAVGEEVVGAEGAGAEGGDEGDFAEGAVAEWGVSG